MRLLICSICFLIYISLWLQMTVGQHFPEDNHVIDTSRGSARELAHFAIELAQYCIRNEHLQKRNSEIINSLLGVPKVLNDAGR